MTQETEQALAAIQPIAADAAAMAETVDGFIIHNDDDMAQIADLVKTLGQRKKKLEDKRKEFTGPLNQVVTSINALFKTPRETIDSITKIARGKMDSYAAMQRQIAEEEARIKRAVAAKQAEDAAKAAAQLREAGDEETAKVAEANAEKAQKQAEKAAVVSPVRGDKASVSTVTTWKAEVVDIKKLCQAIADGRVPVDVVEFKPSALNKIARDTKVEGELDGLRIYEHIGTSVR